MANASIRAASVHTEPPLRPPHNTLSEENTRLHNTLAARDAASRMPAHKITAAGRRQKTAFCPALAFDQNTIHTLMLLAPRRAKWISMRHTRGQCRRTDTSVGANAPRSHNRRGDPRLLCVSPASKAARLHVRPTRAARLFQREGVSLAASGGLVRAISL